MMNLILVEDEIAIRTRIAVTIPWEEHGIQVVGQAENGVQALELMKRKLPDIVLLDIQMPEMDGLALAKQIASEWSEIKLIVLSGHEHFEYARSAMEAGVQRYLLKPAENEEILQAVLEAAGKLSKERESRHSLSMLESKWRSHLPRLRDLFLSSWMAGAYKDWEIERHSQEVQLVLPEQGDPYTILVMEMDAPEAGTDRYKADDTDLLNFALHSISFELFDGDNTYVFQDDRGATVMLLAGNEEESDGDLQLRAGFYAARVQSTVRDCLKASLSVGISGTGRCRLGGADLYRQACAALSQRILYGGGVVYPFHENTSLVSVETADEIHVREAISSDERLLEISIEKGDEPTAVETVLRLIHSAVNRSGTVEEVKTEVLLLVHLLIGIIKRRGWSVQEIAGTDYDTIQNVQMLQSREQIDHFFKRLVRNITKFGRQSNNLSGNKLIQDVLNMIDNELANDISLYNVAERLFINHSYLSRLFKYETGQLFSSYVLERRMTKAKQLLNEGAQVQEAARQVGYTNTGFFSKLFLKHWGILPSGLKRS
ncbi:response regulator transcription factor [Paenibacillus sp. LjRoot56]|uniref:response regulator transcription factor n=1 Tax=Paenibacillus sp. LjRoot56 TaxID=3342333 RepID=UPI003ECD7267